MRGLAGWRRKYWMMIRWYWWIINVGECKCPLVHKYQYWYYDLIISTGISMLDHVIFRYIQKCPSQLDISSPASPSSGLIIAGGNRAAGKKKIPNWKIVFLVGSGNRFLMISDDFWWFRMTSDDFCIKRLQGCKYLASTRLPKHQSKGPWLQKISQTPAGK